MDIVASLYQRNHLADLVRYTAEHAFIPLTVGGGVRSVEDVASLLREGADKVAINTGAIKHPALISEVARRFGAQCMVLGIEAKARPGGGWEAFTDNGREPTGLDVVAWAKRGEELGAGEVLLTSVDREGTRKGFDVELSKAVASAVSIPVILSGGMGRPEDLVSAVQDGNASALAVADGIHYRRTDFTTMKRVMSEAGISVRSAPRAGAESASRAANA